jgi:Phosphoribosylformylglycinamidine (FGAM) synthase, synthetase domain
VSCERIVRRYDYEVQGGTVVKPFAGPEGDAPQDAAVLKPQGTGGAWGIALSNALRPDYAEIDPYRAAWAVVDEAVRNAVAVGSDPERIAILDNFCMGDPNDPAVMWALLESARGLRDAALAFGTPIISGKDSFYNEYLGPDGRRHAVPPSLLVSALGFVPDVSKAVTSFLKSPGDSIWLVGRFEPSFLDKDAAGLKLT